MVRNTLEMKIENVDKEVAEAFGIKVTDIRKRNRRREFSDARQMAWMLLSDNGYSIMELSRDYRRNHSSVCKGIRRIKGLVEVHRKIDALYREIKEKLCC